MNQIHFSLMEKSSAYRRWHEGEDYHLKHWAIFIAIALVALILLTGGINNYVSLELSQSRAATGITYWVSSVGTASWQSCTGSTPLNGTVACSLATANKNAAAGDTVYLRGGTYTVSGNYVAAIQPSNSGTAGNRITFAAYPGETPVLTAGTGTDIRGLWLEGKSYIKVDGLTFKNFYRWGQILAGSHHIEIAHSTFAGDTGEEGAVGLQMTEACVGGSTFTCPVTHNWIHHNRFSRMHTSPAGQSCVEGTDLVRIGLPYATGRSAGNDYNTVEDNILEYGGHALFDNYGMYTVFRNNTMHNEPWILDYSGACNNPSTYASGYTQYNGKFGHRNFQITEDFGRSATHVLVEGNRAGYGSTNPNNPGAYSFELAAPQNIVRYNSFYGSMQGGLNFKYKTAGTPGSGGEGATNNRVYNNTIYHSGYGYRWKSTVDDRAGIQVSYNITGNIAKNNIIYASGKQDIYDPNRYVTYVNNWLTPNGDPKFVNPDISDPSSRTLPDLGLQSTSGAIDGGTYLTQANGLGSNSTTLVVDDALYFQDGTWGSDLARSGLQADWIAIGTVTNVVQVVSINYNTNTITLKSPISWNDGANIWLYKDSGGKQVLYGDASDIGAYEYASGGTPPPPPPPPPPEDTTPPTVSIISPVNDTSITRASPLTIQATALDDVAVSEVKFFINGTLKCTDTSPTQTSIGSLGGQASLFYTCSWNVPGRVGRTYRLQTMAYDTSGNFAASAIVVVTAKWSL